MSLLPYVLLISTQNNSGLSSDSGNSLTVERQYHYCVLALFPHTGQPGQPLLAVAPI